MIIHDSVAPNGIRITTVRITYPRMVHAELMTHRVFSRNAASSRAIPVKTMLEQPMYTPDVWEHNAKGMVPNGVIEYPDRATEIWTEAHKQMLTAATRLADLGVAKQLANRLLEPFRFITVLITSTEWDNFFKLRCAFDAQREIRLVAEQIRSLMAESVPVPRTVHTPYHDDPKESVMACARVSYNKIDGDPGLYDRLLASRHMSPFEHVAYAMDGFTAREQSSVYCDECRSRRPGRAYTRGDGKLRCADCVGARSGNFFGWQQFREIVEFSQK